jgi:hypothetical protein
VTLDNAEKISHLSCIAGTFQKSNRKIVERDKSENS